MEWTDGAIEFFVDGESACVYRRTDDEEDRTESAWPFDQPFYLILNIAIISISPQCGHGFPRFEESGIIQMAGQEPCPLGSFARISK